MLIPDRRRAVLEHVRRTGSVSIEQLAVSAGVSAWTVRRDLAALEDQGLLTRTRGGAFLPRPPAQPSAPVDESDARQRIGRAAAGLVEDHSTILVLGGSTTAAMVAQLRERTLTVITNALDVAHDLRDATGIALVVLGGYLHREQMTLLGPMTEAAMADFHVDAIVAGAWGVDADPGVTGNKVIQGGPHHIMLDHADRLIVVADARKLGRRGPTVLARIEQVDVLVTDTAAEEDQIEVIRQRGVDVRTV